MKKVIILFILFVFLLAVYTQLPDQKLHIYICDVGQGDGILIQYKLTQIVIDAGPDNSIESCLGSYMPFWDRTIEVAVMTHADSDHFFGFTQMAKRYKILNFIGSTIDNPGVEFASLKKIIKEKKVKVTAATVGTKIKINDLNLNVIFPDLNFLDTKSKLIDTNVILGSREAQSRNDFCAIMELTFRKFTALFTCDTSPATENEMIKMGIVKRAYLLKVPHHGSKNGLTKEFLKVVDPTIAAISVAQKNRYGHPSPEVIQMLDEASVRTLRTDESGDIEVNTDGQKVWVNP